MPFCVQNIMHPDPVMLVYMIAKKKRKAERKAASSLSNRTRFVSLTRVRNNLILVYLERRLRESFNSWTATCYVSVIRRSRELIQEEGITKTTSCAIGAPV